MGCNRQTWDPTDSTSQLSLRLERESTGQETSYKLTRIHFERAPRAVQVADVADARVVADGISRIVVAHQKAVENDEDDLEHQQESREQHFRPVHLRVYLVATTQ